MAGKAGRSGRKRFNTKFQLAKREEVLDMCWSYLRNNFHKFRQSEKIRILTALCTKSIPQKVEGDFTHTVIMDEIKVDNAPLRFNIGNPNSSKDSGHSSEAFASN